MRTPFPEEVDSFDSMDLSLSFDERLDTLHCGSWKFLQKKRGYRFSVDPLLLVHFVRIRKNDHVIDLGTGCGIIPILLSQRGRDQRFVGVEIQEDLAGLAQRNVVLNRLEHQVSILQQDFRRLRSFFPPGSFHVVLSNPPYHRVRSGRINPSHEKAVARHEINGTLEDLISMTSYLLPPKGRFYVIYPAARAVDLIASLRVKQLEPKQLQFVYPRSNGPAKFVLAEAVKASGVELMIRPPLIIDPMNGGTNKHKEERP